MVLVQWVCWHVVDYLLQCWIVLVMLGMVGDRVRVR